MEAHLPTSAIRYEIQLESVFVLVQQVTLSCVLPDFCTALPFARSIHQCFSISCNLLTDSTITVRSTHCNDPVTLSCCLLRSTFLPCLCRSSNWISLNVWMVDPQVPRTEKLPSTTACLTSRRQNVKLYSDSFDHRRCFLRCLITDSLPIPSHRNKEVVHLRGQYSPQFPSDGHCVDFFQPKFSLTPLSISVLLNFVQKPRSAL